MGRCLELGRRHYDPAERGLHRRHAAQPVSRAGERFGLGQLSQHDLGPIVLVGHSYGGAVITNAAYGNANVKALVYVDAFEPAQGETLEQLTFSRPGSCLTGGA